MASLLYVFVRVFVCVKVQVNLCSQVANILKKITCGFGHYQSNGASLFFLLLDSFQGQSFRFFSCLCVVIILRFQNADCNVPETRSLIGYCLHVYNV